MINETNFLLLPNFNSIKYNCFCLILAMYWPYACYINCQKLIIKIKSYYL